nr:K422 [uncultured bacterium]
MILITGGLGFIGLHTARRLVDLGESCVLTQYRIAREPDFIKDEVGKRLFIEKLDVTDAAMLAEIGRRHPIDGIIHLAAPGLGVLAPADELRVNLDGLTNILEAASRWGVKRVSLASSVAMYAGVQQGPWREDMPLRTTGGLATEAFKRAFESLGGYYAERASLDVVLLRIGAIYGPLYHSRNNLPSRLVLAAMQDEPPVLRGEYEDDTHDLCYVRDAANGIALLQTAAALKHRVYNVGAGRETANREFVDAIESAFGTKVQLNPGRGPNARDDAFMDLTRIREDVGYSPEWPVERAMADYIAWLRAGNPE